MHRYLLPLAYAAAIAGAAAPIAIAATAQAPAPGETLHMRFEDESELLADFVSQNSHYADRGAASLEERRLSLGEGQFGSGLYIEDGAPKSAGTWNQSGLDCDLIVSVVWGEWRKKPHYWGAGRFHGDRGTVAFWVKGEAAHRGVIFMQGSIGWGRKERDLFTVEVDDGGTLHAHLRDVNSVYHRVRAEQPTWTDGKWHHVAVSYDRAHGMKLFHNGRLAGSTWGEDAWWQAPLPGLFSPFLQESRYDEIRMFDYPMDEGEVAGLYISNEAPRHPAHRENAIAPEAAERLLALYGDLEAMELPELQAGEGPLPMRQTTVASCTDEKIPVGFVMDGRYELAWPTPYRLFTFVLGDADFHGENIHIELAPGENPNYMSFEGALTGLKVQRGADASALLNLNSYEPFFHAQALDLKGSNALDIPLVKAIGLPEDLEGSVTMPLTGETRIHEMQLWEVGRQTPTRPGEGAKIEYIAPPVDLAAIPRYGSALNKLKGSRHQTVMPTRPLQPDASEVALAPLQAIHLLGNGGGAGAVDKIGLDLLVRPNSARDVLWVKLRDPGNPGRYWTQTCIKIHYSATDQAQEVSLVLDIVDLMLASDDRILVELTLADGGTLLLGDESHPARITVYPSVNPEESAAEYATHALLPARMQYMKEYNYRPWLFTGNTITVDNWEVFGGPYDMAYPPLAVLKNLPDHTLANRYKTLLFERSWFGRIEPGEPERPLRFDPVEGAPAWANAQRELLALNREVVDWIVGQQRHNGMFWGGPNDDSFIPLGWAALPFLGHEGARKAWLRFYEGMEEFGIYHDGYCDIWPIDPLHITDFICSRGLMLSYALGDPRVFERELRTAERYRQRVEAANAEREKKNLPPLTGDRAMRDDPNTDLIHQMDAEIHHYSRTHVGWWWGETETRPPHAINDRNAVAAQMLQAVGEVDDDAVFGMTEARVHTDNQRGFGRELLVNTALGGRVQGYTEPFPPSIAATWELPDIASLARLVSYADESRLAVNCFNFTGKPLETAMRVWRLQPGNYTVSVGPDVDDDGEIDGEPWHTETMPLRRFSTIPLEIPPGRDTAITLELKEPSQRSRQLPDLAISPADIAVHGDAVKVTVHNLGAVSALNVRVALVNEAGDTVAEQTIPRLDSPRQTLAAQHAAVALYAKRGTSPLRVVVDPDNQIDEVYEENNQADNW